MNRKSIHALFVLTLLLIVGPHCSDDIPILFDNHHDPMSATYHPAAPKGLIAVASADTAIVLNWINVSRAEEGIIVERREDGSSVFIVLDTLEPRTSSYTDRFPVQAQKTYHYRVAVYNRNTGGEYSEPTVVSFSYPMPAAPVIVPVLPDSFVITWKSPAALTTGFILERSLEYGPFLEVASLHPSVQRYVEHDIDSTKDYRYRIKEFSRHNQSDYSVSATAIYSVFDIQKLYTVNLGSAVHSIAFSPDGSLLAAAGMSYALKVWNSSDGSLVRSFAAGGGTASMGWPFQAVFSPDGSLIASNADGTNNASVNVWRISNGALLRTLRRTGGNNARSICFSSDASHLLAGDFNGVITMWNIEQDTIVRSLNTGGTDVISFLYYSRTGDFLLSSGYGSPMRTNSGFQLWNTADWVKRDGLTGFQSVYYNISRDEKYLIGAGAVWDIAAGKLFARIQQGEIGPAVISSDNKVYIVKTTDGLLTVQALFYPSIAVGKKTVRPDLYTYPAIAVSSDKNIFAAAGETNGSVDLWLIKRKWRTF